MGTTAPNRESETPKPADLVPDDVKANYRELWRTTGRDWPSMADEAERMGDTNLAAWIRSESPDGNDRSAAPRGRTAGRGAQNG